MRDLLPDLVNEYEYDNYIRILFLSDSVDRNMMETVCSQYGLRDARMDERVSATFIILVISCSTLFLCYS